MKRYFFNCINSLVEFIPYFNLTRSELFHFYRKEEAAKGRQLSIIFISDLAELSLETIYMPAVRAYMNVLNLMQVSFHIFLNPTLFQMYFPKLP